MRVCEDWFPLGTYKGQRLPGFFMDDALAQQIRIAVNNVKKDWDFTIIITGGGEVRVGKSVLAFQIMAYWTWLMKEVHGIEVPFNIEDNIVFNWDKLIDAGHSLYQKTPYCPLCYDEAGETMEGVKFHSKELRAVKDYLRECGQYNFLNILVMPEFFDLPKNIAITRSVFLLDVFYVATEEGYFKRGYFKFYSRKNKKKLYLQGKRELDYNAYKFNFEGRFPNFYPINEKEYRQKKQEALRGRGTLSKSKADIYKCFFLYFIQAYTDYSIEYVAKKLTKMTGLKHGRTSLSNWVNDFKKEYSEEIEYDLREKRREELRKVEEEEEKKK